MTTKTRQSDKRLQHRLSFEEFESRAMLTAAYVPSSGDDTVSVISLDRSEVVQTISVGDYPHRVSFTPDRDQAYVVNRSSNDISVIDTSSNQVVDNIPVGQMPGELAMSGDGTRAFVANSNSASVSVIDTETNEVIETYSTPPIPYGISYHPTRDELWITYGNHETPLEVRSADTFEVLARGSHPPRLIGALEFFPDGSQAISVENCGLCGRFHRISGSYVDGVVEILEQDILYDNTGAANDAVVNPETEVVYLAKKGQRAPHRVVEFGGEGRTLDMPASPVQMEISADGSQLFVVNRAEEGLLTVVNTQSFSVVSTVEISSWPEGITLAPPDATSPVVVSVELNADRDDTDPGAPTDWTTQRSDLRSIQVTFSEPILPITADDVVLTNRGVNAPKAPDLSVPLNDRHISLRGNVLTISFEPFELPDGVYAVELLPTLTDLSGNPLDGNGDGVAGDPFRFIGSPENQFYKLEGEFNGDGGVSIFDFPTFAYWFGQLTEPEGPAPSYIDFSGDGAVSIYDFERFAQNFGVSIVYPTANLDNQTGLTSGAGFLSEPIKLRAGTLKARSTLPAATENGRILVADEGVLDILARSVRRFSGSVVINDEQHDDDRDALENSEESAQWIDEAIR